MIPRKTQVCVDFLRERKLLDSLVIHEVDLDLIPIDNDLLSLEMDSTFADLYFDNNETILKTITEALFKLEIVYGPFKYIDGYGVHSRNILNLLQEMNGPNTLTNDNPSQINRLILFDRSADLTSLFVTPLSYEGLIHEVGKTS